MAKQFPGNGQVGKRSGATRKNSPKGREHLGSGPYVRWTPLQRQPWHSDRTSADPLSDLYREMVGGLYAFQWECVATYYGYGTWPFRGGWEAMSKEQRRLLDGFRRAAGHEGIGSLFSEERGHWKYRIYSEQPLAREESVALNRRRESRRSKSVKAGDMVLRWVDHSGSLDQLREMWIKRLEREVQAVAGRLDEQAFEKGLGVLIARLRSTSIGETDGRSVAERLSRESTGRAVLQAANETKSALLDSLENIMGKTDTVSQREATSPKSLTQGSFLWKGHPHELFELFHELVRKGWVEIPKRGGRVSRAQLGRDIQSAWSFASGQSITEATAEQYMKPEGPSFTQGEQFRLPINPRSITDP